MEEHSSSISDHFSFAFEMKLRFLSKKGYKPRQLFNYKKTDLELLSLELSNLLVDTSVLTNPEFLWKFIKNSVIRARDISGN